MVVLLLLPATAPVDDGGADIELLGAPSSAGTPRRASRGPLGLATAEDDVKVVADVNFAQVCPFATEHQPLRRGRICYFHRKLYSSTS